MEDNIEPDWEDVLASQPTATRKKGTGYYAKLVDSLPDNPDDKIAVICWEKVDFRTVRSEIVEALGDKYMLNVILTTPHGIHKWGAGMWSDRFFFQDRVLQSLDELQENDRKFIIALVGPLRLSEFFDVKTGRKASHGLWTKFKKLLRG